MKDNEDEIKNYWSKLLIFLLIVGVCYLTYYKFLVYDKRNNNNANKVEEKNNDNNVVENSDNNNNNKEESNDSVNNTISKNLEEKIQMEIINQKSKDYIPYTNILIDKISYNDLYKLYVFSSVIDSLEKTESNGNFGLTKEELNKTHNELWNDVFDYGMSFSISGENVRNEISKKFNGYVLNFDKSIAFNLRNIYVRKDGKLRDITNCVYEKDIDKYIVSVGGGGVQSEYEIKILDSKFNNSVYTVKYSFKEWSCGFGLEGRCSYTNKNGIETNFNITDDVLLNLPQYEISFKINEDNTYEFKDIKKIN